MEIVEDSFALKSILPSSSTTVRGFPSVLHINSKIKKMLYITNKAVIIRDL